MAAYSNFTLTSDGMEFFLDLLQGGGEMEFRCLAAGSGIYTDEEKGTEYIRRMEALKEERQRLPFISVRKEPGGVGLKADMSNQGLTEGYYITEIGIYAGKKGEEGEVLYCVATTDNPDFMPDASSGRFYNVIFRTLISLGDVQQVTVSYTPDTYVLAEDLQEALKGKVDITEGKDLSSNDYTDEDKHAVEGLGGLTFGQDAEGRWGYTAPGTDEVVPFGRGGSGGSGTMIVKCGNEAIPAGSIIAGYSKYRGEGVYRYLHQDVSIDITHPILYAAQGIAAGGEGTGEIQGVIKVPEDLLEGSLTAYKPVYIKGTLNEQYLNPEYPLVQEVLSKDNDYLIIGMAVSDTEIYLYPESTICQYIGYQFTKGGSGKNYARKKIYDLDCINHASPLNTIVASGSISYGSQCTATGHCSYALGSHAKATGMYSSAVGSSAVASGENSHAEGYGAAKGTGSHAESSGLALGVSSHAENASKALGDTSHAEGIRTEASGDASHTQGNFTKATEFCSSAAGYYTEATKEGTFVCGRYNAEMTGSGYVGNSTGTAFVVGNGTRNDEKSNAFTVNFDGTVSASGAISGAAAADYAEYFEWEDGNPDFEDRTGLFVTLEGDRICTAGPGDGYILGIVSGAPFVLGNGDCDTWNGMFLRDEFGRVMYERAPKIEREVVADKEGRFVELKETPVLDAEGNPLYMGTRPRINPDYNPAEPYVRRSDRPEWSPVGMLGVLAVRQDGSCKVNGYCTCGEGGVAIACGREAENAYRVIKVLSDSVAKVVFR